MYKYKTLRVYADFSNQQQMSLISGPIFMFDFCNMRVNCNTSLTS